MSNNLPVARPTSIINAQRRLTEVGRIRIGRQVPTGDGTKTRPEKLDTFRLTGRDKNALESVARVYGGDVVPWVGNPGQFEVLTASNELEVFVAPTPVTQAYEFWEKGGCKRACDGESYCRVPSGNDSFEAVECLCKREGERKCKLTTRIQFMLPNVCSYGSWRLETHGQFAAAELPVMAEPFSKMALQGRYVPCVLGLEWRTLVSHGKTKTFPVPVIRLRDTLTEALQGSTAFDVSALPQPESVPSLDPPKPVALPSLAECIDAIGGELHQYEELRDAVGELRAKSWVAKAYRDGLTWSQVEEWTDIFVEESEGSGQGGGLFGEDDE